MRRYLQLTRAHTAPLETIPALVGALLATQGEVTLGVLMWGAAGLLYHLSGYGMNSYVDWEKGFDKDDPHKQHHPLNNGGIHPESARAFVYILFSATLMYVLYLSIAFGNPEAVLVVIAGAIAGVLYNYAGKYTEHKYIFISVAHTTMFAAPYLSLGGSDTVVLTVGALMMIFWIIYQISVSGEVKDIVTDEANLLKDQFDVEVYETSDMVAHTDEIINMTAGAQIYGFLLRMIVTALGVTLAVYLGSWEIATGVLLIGLITAYLSVEMLKSGEYRRGMRIQDISLIETATLGMFILAVTPVIGVQLGLLLFVGSGLWLICMNIYLWGTFISPEV